MRSLLLWGPVVLHMVLIFIASSIPDTGPLPGGISDKLVHLGIYALLGALLVRALAGGRYSAVSWRQVSLAVLLSSAYGISDEWHQSFVPGRTPDALDVVADSAGAAIGAILMVLLIRLLARRRLGADPGV